MTFLINYQHIYHSQLPINNIKHLGSSSSVFSLQKYILHQCHLTHYYSYRKTIKSVSPDLKPQRTQSRHVICHNECSCFFLLLLRNCTRRFVWQNAHLPLMLAAGAREHATSGLRLFDKWISHDAKSTADLGSNNCNVWHWHI